MTFVFLALGFVLLLIGGETLVKGSVNVAQRLGIPPLIVGIVLVGFGTSAPELITCIEAALSGVPDMAVGNIVGSNIANIFLVMGVGAICAPIITPVKAFKRDGTALAFATAIFILACLDGSIGRTMGAIFVVLLLAYIFYSYWSEKEMAKRKDKLRKEVAEEVSSIAGKKKMSIGLAVLITFIGIALTVAGAKLLVSSAIVIAQSLGVSETVIGLTIVAIGTSLPELTTAVIAGLRGHSDLSLGNILGSNIYNVLGIIGITSMVQPLQIPEIIMDFDIWVMLAATVMMILIPLRNHKVTRAEGGMLTALYFIYLGMLSFMFI